MFYTFSEMKQRFGEPSGWDEFTPGARQACFGDHISAIFCDMPKGYGWKPHKHEHEQLCVCIFGAIEYTIDGETRVMRQGDTAFLPSYAVHSAVCLEDTRIIDIFTPVRMDQMAWFDESIVAEDATINVEE